MKQFSLSVAPREGIGRGPSRRVRQAGRIPAIMYGKINPPRTLSLATPEFTRLLKAIAGSTAVIEVSEGDNGRHLSILQEIQRDPMTDQILHVDFHEVSADEELEIAVTVHPVGEAEGVRTESGILEIVAHQVRVRCLPKDLPPFIEVDVTSLKLNESIHVRQLPAIAGVQYVDDPGQSVLACVEPVVEVEETPAAAAPVEGAEGAAAVPAEGAEGAAATAEGAKPGEKPAAGAAKTAAAPAAGEKPAAPEKKGGKK